MSIAPQRTAKRHASDMDFSTSHSGKTSSAEAHTNDVWGIYAGEVDSHGGRNLGGVEPMAGGRSLSSWDRNGTGRRGPPPSRRRSIEVMTVEEPTASPLTGPGISGAGGSLTRRDSWPRRLVPAQMVPSVIKVPDYWSGTASLYKWVEGAAPEGELSSLELAAARQDILQTHCRPQCHMNGS